MKTKCIIITNKNSWVSEPIIHRLYESDEIDLTCVLFFNAAGNWGLLKKRFKQYGFRKFIGKISLVIQNKIFGALKKQNPLNTEVKTSYQTVISKGIKHQVSSDLNNKETIDYINGLKPNIVFVVSCSQILNKDFLNNEDIKFINFHDSLLPSHKGPSPSFWVLYNKDKVSGYTIHTIVPKIDSGKIIYRETIEINNLKSEEELIKKIVASLEKKVEDILIKVDNNVPINYQELQLEESYEGIPNFTKRKELKRILKIIDDQT